jgi:phenylacetic acid degradation protein
VNIGEKCFVGAVAVLRADYGSIVIGNGSNVQENCVIHAQPGTTAAIEENVDIGHGTIIHGPCTIKSCVTIGMGAVICDGCELGEASFIGAGSLLIPNMVIPSNKLAVGSPARVIKGVNQQHNDYNKHAVELYQDLCERYHNFFKLITG